MKKTTLLLLCFLSLQAFGQLVDRDQDIASSDFSLGNFQNLDASLAMDLLNQKAQTMAMSLVNKAAAAVPYIGTAGVAMEVGMTNLKFDELLVANKNYNYKLTGVLGNILKVTKEARDGTIASRAKNAAKKIKIVDASLTAIKKCQRTRDALKTLGDKGWTTTNMLRAVNCLDGTLTALEKVGENLLKKTNTIAEENAVLDRSEKELFDINEMMDAIYAETRKEIDDKIASQYNFEYNSSLLNGAMYPQDLSREEGKEKYRTNMARGKNALSSFANVMWLLVVVFFLVAATANVWRVYYSGDDSIALIRYTKAWVVGFAVCVLMASLLAKASNII